MTGQRERRSSGLPLASFGPLPFYGCRGSTTTSFSYKGIRESKHSSAVGFLHGSRPGSFSRRLANGDIDRLLGPRPMSLLGTSWQDARNTAAERCITHSPFSNIYTYNIYMYISVYIHANRHMCIYICILHGQKRNLLRGDSLLRFHKTFRGSI